MEQIFRSWTELASHLIGECFDHANPFINKDYAEIDPFVRFVVAQLFISCHLSSESIFLLLREQKEWDADLLSRAVMEGSIKFMYMLHGSAVEVKAKAFEYWEILPKLSAIKDSERATAFLAGLKISDGSEWQPLHDLIIDESEVLATRTNYSRKERQALEERWSFSGMCKTFALSGDSGLKDLVHLAHGYGMSSHLLHKDADGVGMVWERCTRSPERQTAAKLGHTARIVSDACTFAQLRLFFLLRTCHQPTAIVGEIKDRYAFLFDELKKANEAFNTVEYGEKSNLQFGNPKF